MDRDRTLELKVGIFVFIGLVAIAGFVVEFGRLGEGFKTYYGITVRFKDASGRLKGSDVLFSGAKIGNVAGPPHHVREGEGVAVTLKIHDYAKTPVVSKFTVRSPGPLAARLVNVIM